MKNIYALLIIIILIFGLFTAFAIAKSEDKISKLNGEIDDADFYYLINATNNNYTLDKENTRVLSVTNLDGYAISGDRGERITGLWGIHSFESNGTNTTRGTGHFRIGLNNDASQFKLLLKQTNSTSLEFYIFPEGTNLVKAQEDGFNNSVGSLKLEYKKYSNIALWNGKLVLSSGIYNGTWDITGWSFTKNMREKSIEDMKNKTLKRIEQVEKKLEKAKEKTAMQIEKAQEKLDKSKGQAEKRIQKAEDRLEKAKMKWGNKWNKN